MPDAVYAELALLARCEAIRAYATVIMGLAPDAASATREWLATPKLSWIAPPPNYAASAGVQVTEEEIDVLKQILSMCKLHHAS